MNFSELWGRAQWQAWSARERITDAAKASVPVVQLLLIVMAAFVVGYCVAWWTAEAKANAKWRAQIAAASSAVREAKAGADAEIALSDDQIIERLGDTDAKLKTYEDALQAALKSKVDVVGCPALSTRCYRVRE